MNNGSTLKSRRLAEEVDRLRKVNAAARNLVAALDSTCPDWREQTLVDGRDSDEVNAAWIALVNAMENPPD